jgi:hypothetical protein
MNKKITTFDLKVFGFLWSAILAFCAFKFQFLEKAFILSSVLFAIVSIAFPQVFTKLKIYQSWIKIGNFLGKINGFLISFILFYGIFSPVGFFLRLTKKDLMNKKLQPTSTSYFIDRKAQPNSIKNQF